MFVTVSILGLFVSVAAAEAQEMRELYTTRDATGSERMYRVPENKLLATKKWSPESEDPPLSVQAAVAIARKRLSTKQQPRDLRVIQVQLIASGGQEWRWFYRIELYDQPKGASRLPEVLDVLVLMDGSVVEPSTAGRSR